MNDLAFSLSGVGKKYPYFTLENINLDLPAGTIMGLIGPNGAGKSTTIRILMGLVHQDHGDVQVLGHRMPAEQVAAKWDIGFSSEDMRLYDSMTIAWHMNFARSIYPNWDPAYAQLLLKRFGLRAEQKIKGLSHGQRVKSVLLLILARRPKLLILDEPTTGLDPVARHEILHELTDVMADEGRSILFSSHNTQDVEQISDRITFIDRGRILDSMDKESYLDRWRRLRIEVPSGIDLPALPGVIGIKRNGRLAIATSNDFVPGLPNAYETSGARVHAVETMTLEEIFIANVEHSRDEVPVKRRGRDMNATIIPQLIWKDLRLNRSAAIVPLAGGAIGIGMFLHGGLVAVFGIIVFFTAMILSASILPSMCLLGERKHKTLAFMMSLPISSIQYTIGKMVTVLGIFLVPWLMLVISGVWLILGRADVPKGLLPLFLALCLLVLAGMCVISCIDLLSESEGVHGIAVVAVNVSYGLAWTLIATSANIRAGIWSPVPVWGPTILSVLGGELVFIAALLGLTLFLQSRKKDFI